MDKNKKNPVLTREQEDEIIKNFSPQSVKLSLERYEKGGKSSKPNNANKSVNNQSQPKTSAHRPAVSSTQKRSPVHRTKNTAPPKKKLTFGMILGNMLKFAAILFLVAVSTWLLPSGDKMSLESVTVSEKDRSSVFSASAANLMSCSLEEIHNMPKVYMLEQNDDPAPVPNQSNFTTIDDSDRRNYTGKLIDYYKDETIEAKCWKEKIDGAVYNFAEVKIAHPSQFKRKLVDNVISKKHLDYPLNIFKGTNGVVGMTSDYCAYRNYGSIVQYGNIVRENSYANLDLLIYDKNGNMASISDKKFKESEYYENEDVVFTFAFGPMLVDNYKVNTSNRIRNYPTGEVSSNFPRAAIGQFDYDLHYLLCTVDYSGKAVRGTTAQRLAEVMKEKGCRFAYNLDGGQTAAMMFNNKIFNVVAYGGQREVSDVLYFASAIPNE